MQVVGTASDKAGDVQDSAYDAAGRASDGVQYAKDSAHHYAGKASDGVKYAQDTAAGKAQDARLAAGDLADRAQDTTEQARQQGESTWQKVKETASEMYGKVCGTSCAASSLRNLCLSPSFAHAHAYGHAHYPSQSVASMTHLSLRYCLSAQVTGKADEVHGKAKATVGQASDTAQAAKDHAAGKVTDAYNTVSVRHILEHPGTRVHNRHANAQNILPDSTKCTCWLLQIAAG